MTYDYRAMAKAAKYSEPVKVIEKIEIISPSTFSYGASSIEKEVSDECFQEMMDEAFKKMNRDIDKRIMNISSVTFDGMNLGTPIYGKWE